MIGLARRCREAHIDSMMSQGLRRSFALLAPALQWVWDWLAVGVTYRRIAAAWVLFLFDLVLLEWVFDGPSPWAIRLPIFLYFGVFGFWGLGLVQAQKWGSPTVRLLGVGTRRWQYDHFQSCVIDHNNRLGFFGWLTAREVRGQLIEDADRVFGPEREAARLAEKVEAERA